MTEALIDRIYEAAFVTDLWPDVLAGLSRQSGCEGGAIVVYDQTRALSRQTSELAEMMAQFCGQDHVQRSAVVSYLLKTPPSTFVYDADYLPTEVRRADVVTKRCEARGKGSAISTLVTLPTPDDAVVVLERSGDAGRPDEVAMAGLNSLRPHLARALLISARLGLERARNTVLTLSGLRLPAAVLNAKASLLACNHHFEALKPPFRVGAFDRLSLINPAANSLLQKAVVEVGAQAPTVKSIPLAARDGEPSRLIHVVPIARSAHDIFDQGACIVVVTRIGAIHVPDGATLNGLFDLSPAEARLVQKLAQGKTLDQIAKDLSLSVTTLRTQLRSVFAKTGTTRQNELTRLIGSMSALATLP